MAAKDGVTPTGPGRLRAARPCFNSQKWEFLGVRREVDVNPDPRISCDIADLLGIPLDDPDVYHDSPGYLIDCRHDRNITGP